MRPNTLLRPLHYEVNVSMIPNESSDDEKNHQSMAWASTGVGRSRQVEMDEVLGGWQRGRVIYLPA